MASTALLGRAQALLGEGLTHHELHKALEGQGRAVESFERQGFEHLGALDDDPGACVGREVQGDALAGQGLSHRVVFQIDADHAMAADRAHDRQAIAAVQPAIGVDHLRQGRQVRQVGKGATRGTIATTEPLMGSLTVVVLRKLCRDLAHLLQAVGALHRQTLLLIRAVIALHKAILLGGVRIAEAHGHPQAVTEARPLRRGSHCLADC